MHILPDFHRAPRRIIRCNTKDFTFEASQPRILFPETYLRLANLYTECAGHDLRTGEIVRFEASTYETDVYGEQRHGPLGILCLAKDGIDTVCVSTHGNTLHLGPGIMLVLRDQGEAFVKILKERSDGVASLLYVKVHQQV